MIPDLGRYAGTVLSAYAATLVLLGLLLAATWWRSARVRRRLAETETRLRGGRR